MLLFTSNEHLNFSLENGETPNWVVYFFRERRHIPKNMENVKDFVETSYNNNNDNPWISS